MEETTENIFKKLPSIDDVNNVWGHLMSNWANKLDAHNFENLFQQHINKGNEADIDTLKFTIQNIFKDLSTSTSSQLMASALRFLKKPYSNEVSERIILIHKLLESKQDDYFNKNGELTISLILLLVFISKCVNSQVHKIVSNTNTNLFWYYGSYNKIIDIIQEKHTSEDCYWIDNNLDWKNYINEEIIIVPIDVDQSINIQHKTIRFYVELMSSIINKKDNRKYYFITKNNPPKILLDNHLLKKENIHYIN